MKKGLICLLIVATLTVCVLNVAAATTSKYTTDVHNGQVTDAGGQWEPHRYITLSDLESGKTIELGNCTAACKTAFLDGYPVGGVGGIAHPAYITDDVANIQLSRDGKTWVTILTTTTLSKKSSDCEILCTSPDPPLS